MKKTEKLLKLSDLDETLPPKLVGSVHVQIVIPHSLTGIRVLVCATNNTTNVGYHGIYITIVH